MAIDYPDPAVENPWTDPSGELWEHDGDGWGRANLNGMVTEPVALSGRIDAAWSDIKVLEAPIDGTPYVRQDGGWVSYSLVKANKSIGQSGMVFDFAGGSIPAGALACDGTEVNRAAEPALYAAIGDVWANTGGRPNPAPENFRLPPNQLNNKGLYDNAGNVGNAFNSNNVSHNHNMDHDHTGDTGSGGVDHYHEETEYASNGNGTGQVRVDDYSGTETTSISTNNDGDHTHNIAIDNDNTVTGSQGGDEFRPESVTVRKCIWK